jgi:hypothetical protein
MLDLQAVVQSLGVKGRGKHWVVVTSQEKLGELVSGLDDKKIELARLMDRFPLQVHLEPSDISEVPASVCWQRTRRKRSGKLSTNGADCRHAVRPSAAGSPATVHRPLPAAPYQIDLIQVVFGLRRRAARAHVGGANRTIIKLAQHLITFGQPADQLVCWLLDQVYDLVEGTLAQKSAKIGYRQGSPPLAQPVAKSSASSTSRLPELPRISPPAPWRGRFRNSRRSGRF